jgi:hypothetical protein
MSDPYAKLELSNQRRENLMNDYEIEEMTVSLPCVDCGDTLESWELSESGMCFICEVLA